MNLDFKTFDTIELRNFIQDDEKLNVNLNKKFKYFSYDDLSLIFSTDDYLKHCKFFVVLNGKQIIGICNFAKYYDEFSISYLSTHIDYKKQGIAKKLLFYSIKEIKKFTNILTTSQYSVDGWKYLKHHLENFCLLNDITLIPNVVGYGKDDDEFNKLREESIKQLNNLI
jgi:hypothetical protein